MQTIESLLTSKKIQNVNVKTRITKNTLTDVAVKKKLSLFLPWSEPFPTIFLRS